MSWMGRALRRGLQRHLIVRIVPPTRWELEHQRDRCTTFQGSGSSLPWYCDVTPQETHRALIAWTHRRHVYKRTRTTASRSSFLGGALAACAIGSACRICMKTPTLFARDLQDRLGILALLALLAPFRMCNLLIPFVVWRFDPVSGHQYFQ